MTNPNNIGPTKAVEDCGLPCKHVPVWPVDILEYRKQHVVQYLQTLSSQYQEVKAKVELETYLKVRAEQKMVEKVKPPEVKKVIPVVPVQVTQDTTKKGRGAGLGQCALIDSLLKEGKSDTEITEVVKVKLPTYDISKLPKLIKLRRYNLNRK